MSETRPFAFLNVPDRFIEATPLPSTQLIVVVPLFREYQNGNIFRLIRSFSKQSVPSSTFEVLCVVNNSQRHAETNSEIYQENKLTLAVGSLLSSSKPIPESFSPYQREVIEMARKFGLSLHMIDLTSGGVEGNMGVARQVGVREAITRFRDSGAFANGIIAHLDGDTIVERRYVEKLIKMFQREDFDTLSINMNFVTPVGSERLFLTTRQNELKFWVDRLQKVLRGGVILGGPQLVATAQAHHKVGGVPLRNTGEDLALAEILQKETRFASTADITTYTSDRARMDSFEGRGRLLTLDILEEASYSNPATDLLYKFFKEHRYRRPITVPSLIDVQELFLKCGLPFDQFKIASFYSKVAPNPNQFFENIDNFLGDYYKKNYIPQKLSAVEYTQALLNIFRNWSSQEERDILDQCISRERRGQKLHHAFRNTVLGAIIRKAMHVENINGILESNISLSEFISQNPWVVEKFNELKKNCTNEEQFLSRLSDDFPSLVGPWGKDGVNEAVASIRGLSIFVQKCHQSPESFPQVSKLLRIFRLI